MRRSVRQMYIGIQKYWIRVWTGMCGNITDSPIHPFDHLCDHSALLRPCRYVFLCAKPPWRPLDRSRLSHHKFGMHCRVISHPSQLFLLSKELSNTIFSCLLILTVGHLVASRHLTVSWYDTTCCHRAVRKYHAVQLNALHLSAYD